MANELMFQIGIQEVKEKIDDIRRKFDSFNEAYGDGKGITVKLSLQSAITEADSLIGALKNIGSAGSLKPYENELGKVKQQMEQVANASKTVADASKSAAKEQESSIDNLSIKYATLIQRIENWQANLSQLLSNGGHSNYFDSQLRSAISSYQYLKERVMSSGGSKEELDQLRAAMTLLGQTYANVNKEAKAFNKEQERAIELEQKANSRAANIGMSAAERKRAEMEAAWREQEQMQQKQLQALEKQAQREEQLAEQKEQKRRDAAYKAAEAEVKARQKAEDEITKVANKADERLIAQKQKAAETIRKANERAINALDTKVGRLEARKLVDYSGLDTSKLDAAIKKIREIRNELAQFAVTGTSVHGGSIAEITKKMGLDVANREATVAMQALNAEKRKGAQATSQLTSEEQRLASAIGHSTGEMRGQSQVLSDLKSMAMQYVSVWGASNLLDNIIKTGGQLEQQRLSLSAILGDMEKANTLFGQVKELALKSPFGVVQIDQMTKQLAAYSFEYEELFDWTKRLADISAATGTSVDRLALALGHVRNEGALSGYTLRQFAMANVPVLKMLSENLGISSKDVRDKVRKKEISADDVQQILKQLTDEGGMFFHAQEVMSEALNAKFKNLHDAFDIMYGEIAESGFGDFLKEVANILTQGAKEWERYGSDILMVGAAFGVGRTAIMLYNAALGSNNVSTLKSIAAVQQKENAYYRLANAAGLVTDAEYKQLIYNEQYSASGLKVALTTEKLTIEELQRAVALGKVNKSVARAAAVAAGYDAALISNVRVLGFWRKGIFLIGEGFRAATVAVKGFFAAAWPLLALSAVFDLINRTSQNNDAASSAASSAAKATNKYGDLQAMTERLGSSQSKTNDQLENNIKAMKESLIAVGEYTDELKKQVESVESLAEKYDILHAAMKNVSDKASDKQARKAALLEEGLSAGSGTAWNPFNWFRDNALRDAKDIDDYTKDLYLVLDKNDKVLRDGFRKILETKKEWKKEYESMSAKDIFMSFGESIQDDILYDLRWGRGMTRDMQSAGNAIANVLYGGDTKELKNAIGYSYQGAINELRGHKEELAKAFEDAFRVDYPDIDLSKANEEQKIIFAKWLDETIANLEDVQDAGKKALNDIVIEGTITVRPKYSLDNENFLDFMNKFQEKNPLAYYEWQKHGRDVGASVEEQRKSAESYGKTFSGATQSNIGNEAKKQIKELAKERKNLEAFQKSIVYQSSPEEKKRADDRIKAIDEETKRLKQAQKDYNQYGDPDKSSGRKEDNALKAAKTRLEETKAFLSEYKKYREVYGKERAINILEDLFPTTKGRGQQIVDNYKSQLEQIKNSLKLTTEERKKFGIDIDKLISDTNLTEAKERIDRQMREMERYIGDSMEQFNLYKSLFEKTGSKEFAMSAFSDGKMWDDAATSLANILREKMGDKGGIIDWDADKQSAEDWFKKNFENGEELYKKWEKIVDLIKGNYRNALTNAADSMKDSMTYAERISAIQAKYVEKNKNTVTDSEKYANQKAEESEIARVRIDEFKDSINWDAVFGSLQTYTKKALVDVRKSLREFVRLNRQNMDVQQLKEVETAIANLDEVIAEKSGVFGGLRESIEAYRKATKELTEAEREYQEVVKKYGKDSIQAQDAKKKVNQAQSNVNNSQANATKSSEKTMSKLASISQALVSLGKSGEVTLTDVGNVVSTLITALSSTNTGIGNLIAAIFAILDSLGDQGLDKFLGNILDSVAHAVGGVIKGVGNIYGGIFGDSHAFDFLDDTFGDGYKRYEGAKTRYEGLIKTWDALLEKKKEYLNQKWGIEAQNAGNEALALLNAELKTNKILARERLDAGASMGSHSLWYRMWKGSYQSTAADNIGPLNDGVTKWKINWQDVNQAISRQLGVTFNSMEDMLNMTSDQLTWIKTNYSGLWSQMDEEFQEYLEDIIEFGETEAEILDKIKEKLTGWKLDTIKSEWADLMASLDKSSDALAENLEEKLRNAILNSMIENLYADKIRAMIDSASVNDLYLDKNGNVQRHHYDGDGNITDTDVASEFTKEEWDSLLSQGEGLSSEVAAIRDMLKNYYGWSELGGSSSSTGSSIKGINEETWDLGLSYWNSMRADLSVIRTTQFNYYEDMKSLTTSGNASLRNIENNTAAIMRSNDAIQQSNSEILAIFKRVTQGGDKVRV